MKVSAITQPLDINNESIQLGEKLVELLKSRQPFYNHVWIVSAFANQRAVNHLLPHLETSISDDGHIQIIIGIDHQGTSLEALQAIQSSVIEAKVVHNNQPGHTFHPKIYLFEATDSKAELFVGSNNLTLGGLYTNYEASLHVSFDLPVDEQEYLDIKQALHRFFEPPDTIAKILTNEVIDNLLARGEILPELQIREATKRQSMNQNKELSNQPIPDSLFGNEAIPRFMVNEDIDTNVVANNSMLGTDKDLVWQKANLPASDVQRQRGNPTGGLRLTQARWRLNDQLINQTRYFRYDLFGDFQWTIGIRPPQNQETTQVYFDINILGISYGSHTLTISHKPSGEAGQGNYTTMLHWGYLGDRIKDLDLVGKTFSLYKSKDTPNIFIIDIT